MKPKKILVLALAGYLIVVGQTFQSVHGQAGMPVLPVAKDPGNNWGLPNNLVEQLAQYPNAEVAFICGPQLKAGSSLNPFPWFDSTALKMGIHYGEEAPRVAPFGPMFLAKNVWRNTISGRVSVSARATTIIGKGTRFTRDFDLTGPAPGFSGHFRMRRAHRESSFGGV